jgi:uncharacterized membrane protein YeaQ/YmgE (transglycosylase-associated protein family)
LALALRFVLELDRAKNCAFHAPFSRASDSEQAGFRPQAYFDFTPRSDQWSFNQKRVRSQGGIIMDWIVAILVGALIGWLASMVAKTDGQQGALANVVIGILGASLGRWLFGGVLNIGGATVAGSFSVIGILWGVLGALILIFLLRSVRVLR